MCDTRATTPTPALMPAGEEPLPARIEAALRVLDHMRERRRSIVSDMVVVVRPEIGGHELAMELCACEALRLYVGGEHGFSGGAAEGSGS